MRLRHAAGTALAVALGTAVQVPGPAVRAATLTRTQATYLYYWNHDANFTAAQCHQLPPSYLAACLVAVRLQLANLPKTKETFAQREHYVQLYRTQADFPAADCPLLPARLVAACAAQTASSATDSPCTGASGTVCVPPATTPSSGRGSAGGSSGAAGAAADGGAAAGAGAATAGSAVGSGSGTADAAGTPGFLTGLLGAYPGVTVPFRADPTAGTDPATCTLQPGGPVLFFSNDPERVPGPGILYQDTLRGNLRIFLYHVNGWQQSLRFAAILTDTGSQPVTVYVLREGQAGPAASFVAVGKEAAHHWFEPYPGNQFTLQPGGAAFVDPGLPAHPAAPGQAVNAIYDVMATGPVEVTAVAEDGTQPATTSLDGLGVLPDTFHNWLGTPMRGTFAGADPVCAQSITLPWSGKADLRFGAAADATTVYLHGTSAVDGGAAVVDYGNYGAVYNVDLSLTTTPGSLYNEFALMLHPHDNVFAGMALATGGALFPGVVPLPLDHPSLDSKLDGVLLNTYRLLPYTPVQAQVEWMASAGSSLPVDLLIYPLY